MPKIVPPELRKVRVSMMLDPDLNAVITEFCTFTGMSKSAFVTSALQNSRPTLEALNAAFRKAQAEGVGAGANKAFLDVIGGFVSSTEGQLSALSEHKEALSSLGNSSDGDN